MSRKPGVVAGEKFKNSKGEWAEVIDYISSVHVVIKFENGCVSKTQVGALKDGYFRNPSLKSVFGIGFPGGHVPLSEKDTAYRRWVHMLRRCNDGKQLAYKDCSVAEEWLNYQNFRAWYNKVSEGKPRGWEIDKDLVFPKNKLYSSETCEFIPREINIFLKTGKKRVEKGLNTGVFKERHRYRAEMGGKSLGTFSTNSEAFSAYCAEKNRVLRECAEIYKDLLSERAYEALCKYDFRNYEDEV